MKIDNENEEFERIMQRAKEDREARHEQNFNNEVYRHSESGKGVLFLIGFFIIAAVITIINEFL